MVKEENRMESLGKIWGVEPRECLAEYPCDRFIENYDDVYYRGVSIRAAPEIIFRWLCQMRVAPYSYDLLDNFGRRSPRVLTPGTDKLEIGQVVMTIFELIDFEPDTHLTIRTRKDMPGAGLFGDCVVSYVITPESGGGCRILVKLLIRYPMGIGKLLGLILPLSDLIMMRRQLLNFKELSELMPGGAGLA